MKWQSLQAGCLAVLSQQYPFHFLYLYGESTVFVLSLHMRGMYCRWFLYLLYGILIFVYAGYILNTNCGTRQHDTRSLIWENGGHLGYIQYVLENWKLPDVNPTGYWCFSNPPLFYFISAIFVKIQNLLGRMNYQAIAV